MNISGTTNHVYDYQAIYGPASTKDRSEAENTASTAFRERYLSLGGNGETTGTISPTSLISDAVQKTLLTLQESGSVFDDKTSMHLSSIGVSAEEKERFARIVQEAADKDAYADPVNYIKSLPPEDIEVIRKVHSLAETSGVLGVSTEEGAINLLLPPCHAVDSNNDGIVNRGQARSFQFPPPNAPQSVKDAWDEVATDMTDEERMMAQSVFMIASVSANLQFDQDGRVTGINEPGDQNYRNIFGTSEESWQQLLTDLTDQFKTASDQGNASAAKSLSWLNRFSSLIQAG